MDGAGSTRPAVSGVWSAFSGRAAGNGRSSLEWVPGLVSNSVRVFDTVVLMIAASVAYHVYPPAHSDELYIVLAGFAAVMQLNIFQFSGLYHFKKLASPEYQIGRVVLAAGILYLALLAILYLAKLSEVYSRVWMVMWFALTVAGLVSGRVMIWPLVRTLIRRGQLARRVVVVGSGRPAERLIAYLGRLSDTHIQFLGRFDDRATARDGAIEKGECGTIDDLCQFARHRDIDLVIIAMPQVSEDRLAEILRKLKPLPVDIRLCRDTLEYSLPQSSHEFCGIIPLLRLYDKPVSRWGLVAKTAEDVALSALLLMLLGPLMLGIAAIIRIDSPGPVFFKQKRYGFNNRLITIWKFRTMYWDQTDGDAEQQTTKNDPRVTRVGRFLRRTSIDEVPQLINVLFGEMSLVGPRPHAIATKAAGKLFEDVVDEYTARHRVKPGITGWAQVNGWRGETDTVEKIQQRVRHDLYYIDNWSIPFDLKILVLTVFIVLLRKNAY
jgi:Undecaprenyl-phosphate glucose phosphotransferase